VYYLVVFDFWCRFMLSKTAEYALRAVACLGSHAGIPISADHLAEKTKVPRRYLARVLQDLAASGLVRSRSGPGGGYELCKDSDKISILDVVNTVAPIERIRTCPLGLKSHETLCPLHAELDKAYAATEAAFANVTIRDLVESASPIMPLCETDSR
jgi:Rrf2 family nitric oxide-sensitive transcriptional repressor